MLDNEKKLKRAIEYEDPILFLGSGYSLGALTKRGEKFPTGNELKKELITNLLKIEPDSEDFEELKNYSLPEVCSFTENEKSTAHLTDFLVEKFKNGTPAGFHEKICLLTWKKIYTTNIDDILEQTFLKCNQEVLVQNTRRKSTLTSKTNIEYIKLHGCVNNPSEGLTFSSQSYLDSMMRQDYRFSSLIHDMLSETILFVGHDFNEINIDFFLNLYKDSGFESSKGKLIFINPFPSLLFKSKIKSAGAILLEWTTEKFLNFVEEIQQKQSLSPDSIRLKSLNRFGFENVKKTRENLVPIKKYESNLYFGQQPNWKDVLDEWDFKNKDILIALDAFINKLDSHSGIFSLYGKGLSGKSTYLLRIGIELQLLDFEVWNYTGKYFNYFELFQWIKLNPDQKNFALLFDDASFNYKDLTRLVNLVPASQQLIIITTSRIHQHLRSRYSLVDVKNYEYYIEPKLSMEYAKEISITLDTKGYLGSLKEYPLNKRIEVISKKNDVLNILYEITYGKEFKKRLGNDIKPLLLKNSESRDLLILLAIFEKLDLPSIPKELVVMMYGTRSSSILRSIEDFIKYTSNNDISLRTGFFLIKIMSKVTPDKSLSLIGMVLKNIASKIDNRPGNLWNQLEAFLIKEKSLRKNLKIPTLKTRDLLYELKEDLGGSYNFWIQLGIAEQMSGDFEKALNHFRQAEVINPHSYMVRNAIGRNYLKHANSLTNKSIAVNLFEEGEDILLELIKTREEHQVKAFSTHTYVYEKINFYKKFHIRPSNKELKKLFRMLKQILEKDPEDNMSKHISNYFMKYLSSINKQNIVQFTSDDMTLLKVMLGKSDYEVQDFIEFFLEN